MKPVIEEMMQSATMGLKSIRVNRLRPRDAQASYGFWNDAPALT